MKTSILLLLGLCLSLTSCIKDPDDPGNDEIMDMVFKIQADPNQERLDALGNPSTVPSGNAAQSPNYNLMSAHVIELSPNQFTLPGNGEIVYQGAETTAGGDNAVDFDQAISVSSGSEFFRIPLDQVKAGTYRYIRVSVTYQNYDIDYSAAGISLNGTVASFVGFNTYLSSLQVKDESVSINDDKAQGYWAFETLGTITQGQAPAGATTVPNPIAATSPIPLGSCLVTGKLDTPLTITGDETEDIVVTLSFSSNNSFEWIDTNADGIFAPADGEVPVDMGLRGLKLIVE